MAQQSRLVLITALQKTSHAPTPPQLTRDIEVATEREETVQLPGGGRCAGSLQAGPLAEEGQSL